MKKLIKIVQVLIILALFAGTLSSIAMAYTLPPMPPDTGGGGGGGSTGGNIYTPPKFEKTTEPLKSSDGTIIGHIDGENFNSYMVWAEKNGTIGNITYDLTVEGELSSKPDNCWLDINFLEPGTSDLPPGMGNSIVFAMVNISKKPDGWSWKSGSPKYTLKISGVSLNADDTYYMVRSDGSGFQMPKVSVDASGSQATIKFNPPGDTGIFSLMAPVLSTPTPVPTATPEPSPVPTPLPENNWMWGFPIFIAMFAVGAIAGAAVLFILTRNK